MAKVMLAAQFRQVAQKGTVFCYGPRWAFCAPLIYLEPLQTSDGGAWGFYASDPCWAESDDSLEAFDTLDRCLVSGESLEIETSSTKYMTYDSDLEDAVYMVFEEADIRRLVQEWWPASATEFDKRITPP